MSGMTGDETIKINDLTLCHKHSSPGLVRSTLPDVCKSPTTPVPYVNVAYARDLEDGTTTVFSHGGAMNGIKGSRFYPSYGDEPGVGGGVKSGVNLHEATWLSWSPNVFMEGKPVTRLTDKMHMNRRNTVSIGGYRTKWPKGSHEYYICRVACTCYARLRPRTTVEEYANAIENYIVPEDTKKPSRYSKCVQETIDREYPNPNSQPSAYRAEQEYKSPNGFRSPGGALTRRYMDVEHVSYSSTTKMWDLKFPGDHHNEPDKDLDYRTLAKLKTGSASNYKEFWVRRECEGCKDEIREQDFLEEANRKRSWFEKLYTGPGKDRPIIPAPFPPGRGRPPLTAPVR